MITIDSHQVATFANQLRDVPKDLRPKLRKRIRQAAGELANEIKTNASWSSRIPAAVKIRTGFARTAGVRIIVDSRKAPHARPLEFGNKPGFNRHPVFTREVWVDQPTRPFFMRAVQAAEPQVVNKIQQAIDDTLAGL